MNLKKSRPIFYENSRVPVVLSKIAPIEIGAIILGPFVFARGKMSEKTKTHETIHWQQYIETGIIGFWILYGLFFLFNLCRYWNGREAYYNIPFEKEAYMFDGFPEYPEKRRRFNWWHLR